jgi:[NiFe] hydrogenase assembly HybE family chaperone
VLIAPWFMNLVLLPGPDRVALKTGAKETLTFPSGHYEFMHAAREMVGPYLACALFSPMGDFTSQLQAVDVARATMVELFKSENRAETDRAADIRAAREAELAPPPTEAEAAEADLTPTRRRLITGGLGE